jgi:hypothetical protein
MKQGEKKATKKAGPRDTTKAISGNLEQALKTFNQRGAAYGPSYLQYGEVISSLFPEGINLQSTDDINRFGLMSMIISKLTRYCNQWDEPHKDSIHDLGVYAFMLEGVDDSIRS